MPTTFASSSPAPSSSARSVSSEEADISADIIDEDENEARQGKPEEVTVNLVTAFLEHILYACFRQGHNAQTLDAQEIQVQVERKTSKAAITGKRFTAQDDRGIYKAKLVNRGTDWKVIDDFLAILKAKRAFQSIDDSQRSGTTPVVSNETLAQYLAEAVITWKANEWGSSKGYVRSRSAVPVTGLLSRLFDVLYH